MALLSCWIRQFSSVNKFYTYKLQSLSAALPQFWREEEEEILFCWTILWGAWLIIKIVSTESTERV